MKKQTTSLKLNRKFFLNVDFEIWSKKSLQPLARELKGKLVILYCGKIKTGRYLLSLESLTASKSVESRMQNICQVIQKLSPLGRAIYKNAFKRVFDVGYECRIGEGVIVLSFKPVWLRLALDVDSTLSITLYKWGKEKAAS